MESIPKRNELLALYDDMSKFNEFEKATMKGYLDSYYPNLEAFYNTKKLLSEYKGIYDKIKTRFLNHCKGKGKTINVLVNKQHWNMRKLEGEYRFILDLLKNPKRGLNSDQLCINSHLPENRWNTFFYDKFFKSINWEKEQKIMNEKYFDCEYISEELIPFYKDNVPKEPKPFNKNMNTNEYSGYTNPGDDKPF
jgi:hypothetical protein